MKTFFKDIFAYHHHFNQKIADQIVQHKEKINEKTIRLFCHSIDAHQIWNARILDLHPFGLYDIYPMDECKILDDENLEMTMKILDDFDLAHQITYHNSKNKKFQNSILQILFHISNHYSHHRGQIALELRKTGIEPLATDYIFYKR